MRSRSRNSGHGNLLEPEQPPGFLILSYSWLRSQLGMKARCAGPINLSCFVEQALGACSTKHDKFFCAKIKFYDSPHAFLHALQLYSTCTSIVPGRIFLAVLERCASTESTKHNALFSCFIEDRSVCELLAASGLSSHCLQRRRKYYV